MSLSCIQSVEFESFPVGGYVCRTQTVKQSHTSIKDNSQC